MLTEVSNGDANVSIAAVSLLSAFEKQVCGSHASLFGDSGA